MRRPIFLKIFAGYLLLILVLSGVIPAFVFHSYRTHFIETSTESLRKLGLELQYLIGPLLEKGRDGELGSLVQRIDGDIGVRITVLDSRGDVLADSENQARTMENHAGRPEVATALAGDMGTSVRYSTTIDQDMLYVALPMKRGLSVSAVTRLSMHLENIDPILNRIKENTIEILLVMALLSLLPAFVFSHLISAPIRELHRASRSIARGDFTARVPPRGNDEIQELAESFNDMATRIDVSFTELAGSKEELESIISSMTESLLVLDANGRVRLTNRSADELIGRTDTAGRHYWELIRSGQLNDLVERATDTPLSGEIEVGNLVFLCSVTPIRSGSSKVLVLRDITQARRLQRIKKDLAVNVAHELRTPLTAIKGFTETLLDDADGPSREYLEIIRRHADRLMNIVNDLLDLSDLEAKGMSIRPEDVNLNVLMANVLALFSRRLQDKGLTAQVEASRQDIVIKADPFRLEQLFINLIDNAVKYTELGGVTICLDTAGDSALVRVKDTGIGIPGENLARIFERFYTVDKSRSRRLGGTGLGLAIVKHIAALHKGSVAAASTPYMGTVFTVTLPLSGPSPNTLS